MPLEQHDVAVVGFPGKVENIARHRQQTYERVDRHIENHPELDDARDPEVAALPEQRDGEERRRQIAQAGQQAEYRVEPDTQFSAWDYEGGVEQTGDVAQRLQALFLPSGQRTQTRCRVNSHSNTQLLISYPTLGRWELISVPTL